MSISVLATVLTSSVLGSVHCAGMCGPFVTFYAGADASRRNGRWRGHVGYHAGRLAAYLTLGTLAGALGHELDRFGILGGIGRVAGLLAGALMVSWGLCLIAYARSSRTLNVWVPSRMRRWLVSASAAFMKRPPAVRATLLGLSAALLPCGWLYAFVVAAAGSAHPLTGALILSALWLGSMPALLGLGIGVERILTRLRLPLGRLNAALLIVLGLIGVIGRLDMPALALDRVRSILDVDSHGGAAAAETCGHAGRR